jgi:isopentenyl-diphosphate delta-isomerase
MIKEKDEATSKRKDEHIKICLENDVEYKSQDNGFQKFKLHPSTLVDLSLEQINLKTTIFEKEINLPLLVSGMTGGSELGKQYNMQIAEICQEFNIGMGVGSQRAAIENPKLVETYEVKQIAPKIPLIANLGLPQINKGYGIEEINSAIKMINADAIAIHINPLQELVQLEGDKEDSFSLGKLKQILPKVKYPVILKGVGTGFSKKDLQKLVELNPYAIDVAGAGGTNWTKIEYLRNERMEYVSDELMEQGIATADSLQSVYSLKRPKTMKLIASGGIRNGTDAVKALILGADFVAFALPVLKALSKGGLDELRKYLSTFIFEMKTSMAMLGLENIEQLRKKGDKKIGRK